MDTSPTLALDRLIDGPFFIQLTEDPEPYDGDVPYDGPLWIISLMSVQGVTTPVTLGSFGGVQLVMEDNDEYILSVATDLAAEYLV